MSDRASFIVKIILLSAVLSYALKYLPILAAIPPEPIIALVIVSSPAIIVFLLLLYRDKIMSDRTSIFR